MATKYSLILRDVLYVAIIILLLVPRNPADISTPIRITLVVLAIAQRVWQHVTYYKQTGKIY